MAISLTLEWDKTQLSSLRGDKLIKAVTAAVRNSGDQAARTWRTATVKLLRERRALKVGFLRSRIRLQRPGRGVSLQDMAWALHVDGKSIAMGQFKARKTPAGVLVNLGQKSALIKSAFLLKAGGHTVVARRKGKARRPTFEQFSKRLSDVVAEEGGIAQLFGVAQARMTSAFQAQMEAQLAKVAR